MTYVTAPQSKPMTTVKRPTQNPTQKDMSKSQSEPPTFAMLKDAGDALTEHPPHAETKLKDDENPSKPWSIASARDFEDMSQDMHRLFEGKETEQNWDRRRKAIIKISRITHGNGPVEYRAQYVSFIKSSLDGILKVVDSLRTNVTTAGLNLLQLIADTLGHGVDFMVDFVADTLIARCCNTSKVKRDPAIATFESIVSNATYNKNVLHYVVSASEHKDPNARTAVSGWLIAILKKNGRHCDQAGLLDLVEKCIKNGLNDAKPQVRTPMRDAYAMYARLWPERAERLRDNLDAKTQKMLDSNPAAEPAKSSLKRPSIRDIKAARKKELDARESERPTSAQSNRPSIKDIKAAKIRDMEPKDLVRPPSAQSTRPPAKDVKPSKRRDIEAGDAGRPLSAQSTRPSHKDTKTSRKRDGETEDSVRPPSSQSTRPAVRDSKTTRKRDVEPEETVRLPSTHSHNPARKRDMEAQDDARPLSAQLHTITSERRFHILSSAPMRPQRAFADLKRVVPKPAPNLQQQADFETPTAPQVDAHRIAKQTDKRTHGHKKDTPPSSTLAESQSELTTTKLIPITIGEAETQPRIQDVATPAALVEIEPFALRKAYLRTGSDNPPAFIDDDKRVGKHSDVSRNVSPSWKQDKIQPEKPIEIHEDKVPSDQGELAEFPRVTMRRSGEKMNGLKDVTRMPSRKDSVRSPSPPTVLREIDQLNQTVEPLKRQENTRQKYINTETAERNRSVSPHSQTPDKARKQLSRAIEKIRARTMDDYGYRRLQGLIKAHDTLFQDERKYDELLLALLDMLETPNTERRQPLGRLFENKFQILVTIRLMLVHNAKYCAPYHPRALSALMTARRNFESRCHIVGGLEETAEDIVAACSPADVIDHILDVLELQECDEAGYRAISMGLHILSGLVARIKESEISDESQEQRLTQFALKCLRNENSETRRATIAFCVELRRVVNPEERYFQMVAGNDDALKSLLTYFIATTRRR